MARKPLLVDYRCTNRPGRLRVAVNLCVASYSYGKYVKIKYDFGFGHTKQLRMLGESVHPKCSAGRCATRAQHDATRNASSLLSTVDKTVLVGFTGGRYIWVPAGLSHLHTSSQRIHLGVYYCCFPICGFPRSQAPVVSFSSLREDAGHG